jgi:hypothetical protein
VPRRGDTGTAGGQRGPDIALRPQPEVAAKGEYQSTLLYLQTLQSECVLNVYFQGHRAKPLTGLSGVRPKGGLPPPPPVVPNPESLAAQLAYTEAMLSRQ